jgi:peptidoglycan/LPS O-acetylase OafA/YrhL
MKLPYYKSLDGLRGIAAMLVVIFHFYSYPNGYYSTDDYSLYKKVAEIGQHGVSLFFVLSGFVITRILIHGKDDSQYFSTFFRKRILRIAPLYYLFLITWFFILPFIIQVPSVPLVNQLPYYFYLQNIFSTLGISLNGPPHFWSLAVEEHFYVLWPLAVFYIPTRHLGKVIGVSVVLVLLLKYVMIQNKLPIHDFTFTRMDQLLMGSYLALLEVKGRFKTHSARYFLKFTLLTIPLALILYSLESHIHFAKELFKYSLLGIMFASFLATILSLKSTSIINRLLATRVLQYLGRISYGIYVWHVIALIFLHFFFLTKTMFIDILITVALTLLFAHISYFYFETHFIKLKNLRVSAIRFKLSRIKSIFGLFQTFTRSWRM